MLNLERVYLKKTLFDQLLRMKNRLSIKSMDVKHGALASSIYLDADLIRRFEEFIIGVQNLLEQYARDIVDKYRQVLTQQDIHRRTPLHYGAMSKYTNCYKTLEALLTMDIDLVNGGNGVDSFVHLFWQVQDLDCPEDARFDPRKYKNVLAEFQHLLSPSDFKRIKSEFRANAKALLTEALNIQDNNYHTPLHISSFFGDFKASRLFTRYGAATASEANSVPPLQVSKDKFSRDVLQTLNEAAVLSNKKELEYLVNCGENIDARSSIANQAPIHKAVLSGKTENDKTATLEAIFGSNADINITDSNGWTALHHAAYNGDYRSVESLLKQGAKINAFSNQFKTPLHLAASQNHPDIVEKLIQTGANLEAQDE